MPGPFRTRGLLLPALVCLVACPVARATPRADGDAALLQTAGRIYAGVRTETLANGLRVYLRPMPGAPTVTTMVAYRVGSADEDLGVTGLSHYLEHLMFKGTEKRLPGDIDRLTQRNGGRNNAYTSEDMTVFHFDFAADRWTVALEVEADRMRNLRIDARHEFEQEKGAVIAELEGNEDQPWELEHKAILPLLFGARSPYGHPVIGQKAHVRGATAEVIKRYYDTWYHPNNAVLVVCGGFDAEDALARIRKLFGPIPRAELPARKPTPAPRTRAKTVRYDMESKFEAPRILMGFNTVAGNEPDAYALDVLQNLLSGGKTSRLYLRLVEGDRLATSVSAAHAAGRYPGWFSIQAEAVKKDLAKVQAAIHDELRRVADEGVPEDEWRRVRRGLIAASIFGHENIHDLADTVTQGVAAFDLDYVSQYLARLAAVTPDDIKRVARRYLVEAKGVEVWSQAQPADKDEKRVGSRAAPALAPVRRPSAAAAGRCRAGDKPASSGPGVAGFSLKDAKPVTLANGLTLLLLENHRMPIVAAEAYVRGVQLREPDDKAGVAALVGDMLAEGAGNRTGAEIARAIEDVGGVLSMDSAGGTVKVLTPDAELGLGLLVDCLTRPTFPAEEFERQRERLVTHIDDEEGSPQSKASLLFHELVYGKKHPFGRSRLGRKDVVPKLTAADCRAFHEAVFRPNNTLLAVVGDFDSARVMEIVRTRTAGWARGEVAPVPARPLQRPKMSVQRIESDEDASQLHVYLGHLGVRRDNPDYYTLLVLDNILGTGPGFTDRLSASLRDRQGLAYTVNATITGSADEEVGTFVGYIGTYPDKFEVVKDGFLKQIRAVRDEPPTRDEVDNARRYLLGSVAFRFTTNESVAGQLLQVQRFGLGFDHLEKYRRAVEAVTPEAVQAAARKYLDPERISLVAVGPIDKDGKPLKKAE